jgi:syringomycin synthetase protein SyrE
VQKESDFDAVFQRCQELRLVPEHLKELSAFEFRRYCARVLVHMRAAEQYVVKPIAATIDLFVAAEPLHGERSASVSDPLLGWGAVLPTSQIRTTAVPGNHWTMLDAVNVSALGRALSRAIKSLPDERIQRHWAASAAPLDVAETDPQ